MDDINIPQKLDVKKAGIEFRRGNVTYHVLNGQELDVIVANAPIEIEKLSSRIKVGKRWFNVKKVALEQQQRISVRQSNSLNITNTNTDDNIERIPNIHWIP